MGRSGNKVDELPGCTERSAARETLMIGKMADEDEALVTKLKFLVPLFT